MDEREFLAEQFEANRGRLRGVAYRMLGSASEADDAVQEGWLRVSRAGIDGVENLGGWLTTVVARVCLDMLRTRKSRREEVLDANVSEPAASREDSTNPEQETLLADSVGLALLMVLNTLAPAERVAFVLHDMFAVPFDDIAAIVNRSPTATRQLASRARRRVQGTPAVPGPERTRHKEVVEAFLAASRGGDFGALLEMLDPDVVFRADEAAVKVGSRPEIRGAEAVARSFLGRAQTARTALVDGAVGVIVPRHGQLFVVLGVTIKDGKIAEINAIADPASLSALDLAVLHD
jgi:RNA polymerase sigma-70 factor, ECF subfamily